MPRRLCVLFVVFLFLAGCSSPDDAKKDVEATFDLRPVEIRQLDGWRPTGNAAALRAFRRSCEALADRPAGARMVPDRPAFGTTSDWLPVCEEAQQVEDSTDAAAQRFFRRAFRPYRVVMGTKREGLFTGYYEPQLQGSRRKTDVFSEPLHRPPADLIRVNLGDFRSSMDGERLFGRVDGSRLVPYYERSRIQDGILSGRGLEIVYVDSRVDKFFLQIQGSGRVLLRDSSLIRVGYAAANGQPYRAIGRDLIAMEEVAREDMSMQAIRQWMAEHPDRTDDLMNRNRSYVFFRERTDLDAGEGPIGAQGVPLTAGHSIAVDPRFLPYGAPLWLSSYRPLTDMEQAAGVAPVDTVEGRPVARFRRMMIAQDTGGAIRGAIRGDVFWGSGDRAAEIAGRMQSPGTYVVFLPDGLAP
ncbi:murein transglycosylase A [Longibacter sp.]|jgi:membrane-bound lytic murein transglycosylase A|uniref:murein transglycosylase A n=1 Tax=Longibacter sp. TaxID=2045415 RepID=UPI003EC02AB1